MKEELWNKGKQNVDREFESLLSKFSDLNHIDFDEKEGLDQTDDSSIFNTKGKLIIKKLFLKIF